MVASTIKGENTNMATHNGNIPSRLAHNEKAATRNPSVDEPTSPMNIFAGGKLKTTNPKADDAITRHNVAYNNSPACNPRIANVTKPMTAIPPAKPSIPSMKLYRLTIHTIYTSEKPAPTAIGHSHCHWGISNTLKLYPVINNNAATPTCTRNRILAFKVKRSSRKDIIETTSAPI